jgi:hypothetical protein
MNRRLWKGLLLLNCVGLLLFLCLTIDASLFVPLRVPLRVMELDRAGVFNEEKLREFDREYGTDLAANLRPNVGHWIADPASAAAVRGGYLGIGMMTCNIILLLCARPRVRIPAEADRIEA